MDQKHETSFQEQWYFMKPIIVVIQGIGWKVFSKSEHAILVCERYQGHDLNIGPHNQLITAPVPL